MTTVGQNVRELRISKGITQAELAKMVGTYQSKISLLEKNHDDPGPDLLARVYQTLAALPDAAAVTPSKKNLRHVPRPKPIDTTTRGGLIRKARIEKGLTQQELAHLAGVSKPEPEEESRRPFLRLNLLPKIDKNIDFLLDHWLYVDEPTGASVFEHIHPVPGLEHLPEANRLRPRSHETPWWQYLETAKPPKESREQMAARIEKRRHYVAILHSWGCTYKEGLSRLQELGHFINPVTWFRDVKHVKSNESDTTGSVGECDADLLEVS